MGVPQHNSQTPDHSNTPTVFLSLRTKKSMLCLSIVERLKDLNIGYDHPLRQRSSRGSRRKKHNVHPFIVASFNAQSEKGNDMAFKHYEISTCINDNSVDVFLVTET